MRLYLSRFICLDVASNLARMERESDQAAAGGAEFCVFPESFIHGYTRHLDATEARRRFAAISLRQSMERPEAQDAGTIILTGFEPQVVLDSVALSVAEHKQGGYKTIAADYTIENTSWRVLKLIMGNTRLSNMWYGVR